MKNILFLLCLISIPLNEIYASSKGEGNKEEKSFGGQILSEFVSPLTTDAKYIVGGSVLAAGMVYFNKGRRTYNKRESFESAQPFGSFGFIGEIMGWGFLNGFYTLGQFYYGYNYDNKESLRASEHMFKASLYTLTVTVALKSVIQEKRPGYPEDRNSFPSGHSSMSFAFASVVAARHGWVYGSLAYGAATYISVSRINDDWHYLHDVLFGIGIGAGYGWGLKYAYDNDLNYQIAALPTRGGGFFQISADY